MFIVLDAVTKECLGKITSYEEAYVASSTAELDGRIILSSDPTFQSRVDSSAMYLICRLGPTVLRTKFFRYQQRQFWIYQLNRSRPEGSIVSQFVQTNPSAILERIQNPETWLQRQSFLAGINWKNYPHFRLSSLIAKLERIG